MAVENRCGRTETSQNRRAAECGIQQQVDGRETGRVQQATGSHGGHCPVTNPDRRVHSSKTLTGRRFRQRPCRGGQFGPGRWLADEPTLDRKSQLIRMVFVPSEVVAVVNPVAGRARGQELCRQALSELRRRFGELEIRESSAPGDGVVQARAVRDRKLVVAVGGDGTVREVAEGLVDGTAELAIVPVGSGNDFVKTAGVPRVVAAACRVAAEGRARAVDMVRMTMSGRAGTVVRHYINVAGFGFDAMVVAQAQRSRRLRGLALYVAAVFRAVRDYRCPPVRLATGDREWRQGILLCAAANGRLYGGGMRIAPAAEPDDGQLDVCVAEPMNRPEIIRALPRLVAGTHVTMKKVKMLRVPELTIELLEPTPVQLDGDVIDSSGFSVFHLQVRPAAVQVRVEG